MSVPEAPLVPTEHGLVPKGQGWFVLNAREAQWWERDGRGVLCEFEGAGFEGAADFEQLGINVTVLAPGEPMSMYHYENDQEDFLVLAGEALGFPTHDPHGDPIPDANLEWPGDRITSC